MFLYEFNFSVKLAKVKREDAEYTAKSEAFESMTYDEKADKPEGAVLFSSRDRIRNIDPYPEYLRSGVLYWPERKYAPPDTDTLLHTSS